MNDFVKTSGVVYFKADDSYFESRMEQVESITEQINTWLHDGHEVEIQGMKIHHYDDGVEAIVWYYKREQKCQPAKSADNQSSGSAPSAV